MFFEFATAQRIVFGAGRARQLLELIAPLGAQALLVTGRNTDHVAPVIQPLLHAGQVVAHERVEQEPDLHLVQRLVERARVANADLVIAIGGGSVIDAGKATGILLHNPGDVLDYLEVVGRGNPLQQRGVPVVAVPTTAGTGSEVTRNAVLAVPPQAGRPGLKVSLRSPHMLPALALIDPELTYSLPPSLTATTGMDALTQCLEPLLAPQASPLTDGIAREGLLRAARSLRPACGLPSPSGSTRSENGEEKSKLEQNQERLRADRVGELQGDEQLPDARTREARMEMAVASLSGGLALANARLGAVHGFAGVIGGMFPAPHGAVCARVLPPVFAANHAAAQRENNPHVLGRLQLIAGLLTGDPAATVPAAIEWLDALVTDLQIPRLADFGIRASDFAAIAAAAAGSSSMQGNPVTLSADELHAILAAAL